jgi:hypothetical protein
MKTPLSELVRSPSETVDTTGRRVILHTCAAGQLTSVADKGGRVRRQELLFEKEVIVWQHGTRIRTGQVPKGATDSTAAKFDAQPNLERLTRARLALGRYRGSDKYVTHFERVLALSAGLALVDTDVVTRTAQDFEREGFEVKPRTRRRRWGWWVLGLVGAALLAGLTVLWLLER